MKTKLTTLILFTLLSSSAFANWSYVGENDTVKAYLDPTSIKTVKMKVKEATIGLEPKDKQDYSMAMEKVEFVCGSDAYKVFSTTKTNGSIAISNDDTPDSKFKSISGKEDDRLIDTLYRATCSI